MGLEVYARQVLDFVETHAHWAPWIAFILAFGESLVVVSLFFPATFVLVGLGALIAAGGAPFLPVWLAATLGAILGDAISYAIGYHLKDRAPRVWPLRNFPDLMARGERFFLRYGIWSVFIGRFFGPLRAFIPLIAGMFAMPNLKFQIANIASAMAWAFLLLAPSAAAMKALGY
ncbi:membrane protein DedA with SNARE-associated domain [Ancylobacter aquaticus]|uniref:Membrane protein DedA with SNARE-associated domain n=1 Tax=Ancylobacter aquaticus TaxID=100 RepID=A0A4R1I9D0_ANCAQ|nr:DedA family protein [Ancylobacter aquaticus]TCK30793.1 membrane protein DedA with SNARE-associated domain [Ancylobacter aquaticus]